MLKIYYYLYSTHGHTSSAIFKKVFQNSASFKISPLYDELNLHRLDDIYKLEVLKCMFSFKKKIPPSCFKDYFTIPSEIHKHPTRFACDDNWAVNFHCTKSTSQKSIKFTGCKLWNDLPSEFKFIRELSAKSFSKKIKTLVMK